MRVFFSIGVPATLIAAFVIMVTRPTTQQLAERPLAAEIVDRCARLSEPGARLEGLQRAGVVHLPDGNRLMVNDFEWFRLTRQQRAGIAVIYSCASEKTVFRIVSTNDGRILARYVDGNFREE